MKTKNVNKEPVTIRYKELANGNQSIYLDIYKDGKRAYEFLKLYLLPETGKDKQTNKRKNAETMAVVNVIKAQRIIDIKNGMAGIETKTKGKMKLFDYIDKFIIYKKKTNPNYLDSFLRCAKNIIRDYKGENVLMKDIDKKWCIGFIDYLNTAKSHRGKPLSKNSIHTYYRYFGSVLAKAAKDKIISSNPMDDVETEEKPKSVHDAQRVYLTIDEVKMLIDTECEKEIIKKAFLFACFCGLRISDIRSLKWNEIEQETDKGGTIHYRLCKVMQKTQKKIVFQLPYEAVKWLPERGDDEFVFHNLTKKSKLCQVVRDWAKAAGIKKYVTFHTSSHNKIFY